MKYFVGSQILSTVDDEEFIISKLEIQISTLKLLWSGSTHGWGSLSFRKRCVNEGPTITLIKPSGMGNQVTIALINYE